MQYGATCALKIFFGINPPLQSPNQRRQDNTSPLLHCPNDQPTPRGEEQHADTRGNIGEWPTEAMAVV
jgi:hypothetical protein